MRIFTQDVRVGTVMATGEVVETAIKVSGINNRPKLQVLLRKGDKRRTAEWNYHSMVSVKMP